MSKKTLEKQRQRDEKLAEAIKSGKVIKLPYEERNKKKSQPNRKSQFPTKEDEMANRQETIENATIVYRQVLPTLLKRLEKIKDPRQPLKVKHKITVLMIYGILMFVYQIGSRRNANKDMTTPIFLENIRAIFPEFETIPHADTLARLLESIDVEEIQSSMVELLKTLIKNKKFKDLLINKKYLIAVDGSQKFFRNYRWQEEALKRTVGGDSKMPQYYVYTLDAVLVLDNGMVLPVLTEILENNDWIEGETKQDCERKAFKRLAPKIKRIFGKSNVVLLGDGLYACGPVIKICKSYNWDFMLVLKEDGLKDLWKEATGLMRLEPEDSLVMNWGERIQVYRWANGIEYEFGTKTREFVDVNVVICNESWKENHSRSSEKTEEFHTRYAWVSSKRLTAKNVFQRCTKIGRYRWKIENNFLIEKHEGYNFEHCYSYNWQAMKGFHYLMKIGHFVNALLVHSEIISDYVDESGIQGFIKRLFVALTGAKLDTTNISYVRKAKYLWRIKKVA